jgi:hypothetical protein
MEGVVWSVWKAAISAATRSASSKAMAWVAASISTTRTLSTRACMKWHPEIGHVVSAPPQICRRMPVGQFAIDCGELPEKCADSVANGKGAWRTRQSGVPEDLMSSRSGAISPHGTYASDSPRERARACSCFGRWTVCSEQTRARAEDGCSHSFRSASPSARRWATIAPMIDRNGAHLRASHAGNSVPGKQPPGNAAWRQLGLPTDAMSVSVLTR